MDLSAWTWRKVSFIAVQKFSNFQVTSIEVKGHKPGESFSASCNFSSCEGKKNIYGKCVDNISRNTNAVVPSMNVHIVPAGTVMLVELILRHQETHGQKALKLIRPIQDHFLVSWVKTHCQFGFRF